MNLLPVIKLARGLLTAFVVRVWKWIRRVCLAATTYVCIDLTSLHPKQTRVSLSLSVFGCVLEHIIVLQNRVLSNTPQDDCHLYPTQLPSVRNPRGLFMCPFGIFACACLCVCCCYCQSFCGFGICDNLLTKEKFCYDDDDLHNQYTMFAIIKSTIWQAYTLSDMERVMLS